MATKKCANKNRRLKETSSPGAPTTIVYNEATQMALSGGRFDARIFFNIQNATGLEEVEKKSKLGLSQVLKIFVLPCISSDGSWKQLSGLFTLL
jgi:hypothetical protein